MPDTPTLCDALTAALPKPDDQDAEILSYVVIVDRRLPNGDRQLTTFSGGQHDAALPWWDLDKLLEHAPRTKPPA